MTKLDLFQLTSSIAYVIIIGFPVIIMNVKAREWEKEFGKNFRLRIHNAVFNALILSSILVFDYINLLSAYLLFVLPLTLIIFSYQIKEYEPSFNLMEVLKSKKRWFALLVVSLMIIPILTNLIADELLKEHDLLTKEIISNPEIIDRYNLYKLKVYYDKNETYFDSYDDEYLSVQQKGRTHIVLIDTQDSHNVYFSYYLDRSRWKLEGIFTDERKE